MRLLALLLLLGMGLAQQQQQILFQTPSLAQAVGWVGSVGGQDALVIGDLPDPAFARVLPSRTRVLVSGSLPGWVRTGMEVRYLKGLRGRGMLLIDRRYFVVNSKGLWTVLASPEIGMQVAYYLEQLWNLGGRT
ncbi:MULTISPECIES: hypothetical protein [Meiothermus]|uniref:Uncharacterized protein n=2 Tax=Meiothermus TaxID=65551 RepID=D3PNB5_MEIRD|nr:MULTISPECIES: hypothetical protein [Meiothermus]ADD27306.1 hypothetical protein Mrub_0531 [Meiothermus ruber DSM 1279]AGK03760.1 hypothetical protein K649_02280 [Meiothermus ruber DSM 1279]GEM83129.1 hypothetical protein MHY01S_12950 [Meiothermus hypogaeus NBRC 106114]GIW28974.1 MAG: hypothetical protein KatS3mg070_2337 [Meiothermus sp.]